MKKAPRADIDNPFLRVGVAAKYLGIGRTTLYRWQKERGFPPPIEITSRVRGWHKHAIDAWLAEHVAA